MSRGDGSVVSSAAADLVELQEEVDRVVVLRLRAARSSSH